MKFFKQFNFNNMPSKRSLKKSIRYACGNVAGECIFANLRLEGLDQDKVESLVCQTALLQETTIVKVTAKFDKKVKEYADAKAYRKARREYFKAYYAALRKDFYDSVKHLVEEMNSMLTPAQKEENKKEVVE